MKRAFAGVDVGARELVVAFVKASGETWTKTWSNDESGHRALRKALARSSVVTRVCLEATGAYHLDLAIELAKDERLEVMVANPRATRDFARAHLQRSKTDRTDAESLRAFAQRMPFVRWSAPSPEVLELRAICRYLASLARERAREKQRLAAIASAAVKEAITAHVESICALENRLVQAALDLVRDTADLQRHFDHLVSVRGIGSKSAVLLLAELVGMPSGLSPRQWVAHAGLDPRHFESGSSVRKRPRISRVGNRRLRAALYMPAVVSVRFEPHIRAYYEHLLERGKCPMQALVAVMRKLLHSIHGMLNHDEDFVGAKFFAVSP